MKHILFFLLLLPFVAFAQWPAAPNKIRLGNQTTGDGLVVRTAASPSWTPSSINNAWLAFDTVAGVFYYYDAGIWNAFTSGGGGIDSTQANNGLSMSGDTVQLGGTLSKNTEVDINGKTLRFRDAAGYPDLFMNGTYGVLSSDVNTYLDVGSTSGRARIVAAATAQLTSAANTDVSATDTVTITGQRIRMNAADTRIQQVPNDNALNRLAALDSLTGQLKYVDKSSIAGGADTNFGITDITATGDRAHAFANYDLSITGIDSFSLGFTKRTFWTLNGSRFLHQTGGRSASDLGDNLFLGWQAGQLASASATGYANTVIGRRAGYNLNSTGNGSSNTILGYGAGESLVSGIGNTFIGTASGSSTTGGSNTFVGWHAGLMSGGSSNIFMGVTAGESNTASEIIGIGQLAGRYNTGVENVFLGHYAGNTIATGDGNIFIGFNAGRYMDNTAENVIIGNRAGGSISNTSTGNNTIIGDQAGAEMTSGNNNTFIGRDAGKATTTGSSNTLIGASVDLPDATQSNSLMITRDLYASGVNSSLRMGVGSSTFRNPLATFHVRSTTKSSADTIFAVSGSATGSSQYENLYVTGAGKTVVQNETATNVALEISSGDVDAYNDMRVRGTLQVDTRTGAAAKLGAWTSGGLATALVIGSGLTVSNDTITASGSAGVTGGGTTGTIPVWSSGTALGNSPLTVTGTDVTASGTGFFLPPIGTTAQRPGSGSAGMLRYNTSNGNLDFYGASAWENPVKSTNATGLGTAQYVGFYDANGRLTGGNAGLRFITSPYPYIQYGQSVNLTDNTLFYWLNGYSESRNISNNSGATRTAETGAWRVVATPTGNNAFSNFNGANVIALTGSTHVGGSIIRAGRFEASNSAGAGASTMVGAIGRAANASTNGATSLSGFLSEVVNTAGTTPLAYGGTTSVINTATLTNTYGWHVGDITSGTQTNTPRSFYAEDGNAINVFNGSTMMGTDATPSRTLHVTGEARITDLTTDTPTRIVGADADGDLGQMTLGGNLTITSGMLSADNTNLTLADEGNGVRILSSTGTDVDLLEDSGVYITRSGNAAYFGKYMDYGEASIFGAQTLAFLAGSTSYDTLSGYTEQQVGNFVLQGGALKYTGSRTIIARVTASISLSFPETGTIFAGFRQNTSSITKSRAQHKAAADEPTNISLTCILTIAPNDLIRIELAPGAHTGDDNITVTNCNFNITEL